ncbi:hypothetical protein ES332_A07G198000v1 [Gossypium tomentosum]|uniref:DCD domain-containing protein n=1 Tax=Gossypium tomentosum TaxID=34277 RepID=A0A5D2PXM2_GOSTO|nr:hypothetical protein ES332_A07G198000v1 [Gossypium tomentosum]
MGAGRKTQTFTASEKAQQHSTVNCSTTARNLRKSNLAGVIFGCKHSTFGECLSKQLFGLPSRHYSYVKNIEPGLPLFLFNYSDRKLHGIFEAASSGQLSINSSAWTIDGSEDTPYAAQVKIKIQMRCQPLLERQFQPIIADNYYERKLFWFELDQAQTNKLISLFSSSPVITNTFLSKKTEKMGAQRKTLRAPNAEYNCDSGENSTSKVEASNMNLASVEDSSLNPIVGLSFSSVVRNMNVSDGHKSRPNVGRFTWKDNGSREERQLFSGSINNEVASNPKQAVGNQMLNWDTSYSCVARHSQKKWSAFFKEETGSNSTKEVEEFNLPASEVNVGQFNGELDAQCLPDCLDESSKDAEAPLNLEEVQEYGKVASSKPNYEAFCSSVLIEPSTSYLHLEVPREENLSELPTEGTLFKSEHEESLLPCVPREIVPTHNQSEDTEDQLTNLSLPELALASKMNSSCIHSTVAKLVFKVGELRLSEFKQAQKVNSLEEKLVESRLEIQQLKNKCRMLEIGFKSRCVEADDFEEEKFQLVDDQPHPAYDASICIVGGFDGCSWLSSLDIYSSSQDMMRTWTTMSFPRSYASAAKFSDALYILGGVDGNLWYDTVESYNPLSNQWTTRPPLNQKKGSFALLPLEDSMFVVGGGNGLECFSEVEMFDPNIGKWMPIQSLLHKRFAPAAAEVHGILYVSGGYNGNSYLKSIERLDPRHHAWEKLESMVTKRGSHSLVVLNEKLYAIGGFDGNRMVSTVEVFDPRAGSCMMVDSMNNSRGCFGTIVIGEEIHVIGGLRDDKEVLDKVECYKDGEGWQVSNWKAIGKRCCFSVVLV